ncbi:hypothetical protein RhiirC2_90635 [Rhizophagus irregularis]|uniref:Transmembrane protein n=1 Tax=Rhizophagus irregularis TaxID=588596 RepID=A0A2N1MT19_9GLOM|nr:hypothetical protein RhiirC2_90635 [Rhizophagus irregularis]
MILNSLVTNQQSKVLHTTSNFTKKKKENTKTILIQYVYKYRSCSKSKQSLNFKTFSKPFLSFRVDEQLLFPSLSSFFFSFLFSFLRPLFIYKIASY